MLCQVRGVVPAGHDLVDVEAVVLADGDQRPLGQEHGHFAGLKLPAGGVQAHRVGAEEQVGLVAVQLWPLVLVDRILDGQGVQPELLRHRRQVVLVRDAQVQPDNRAGFGETVGDIGDREALGLQDTVAVHRVRAIHHSLSVPAPAAGTRRTGPDERSRCPVRGRVGTALPAVSDSFPDLVAAAPGCRHRLVRRCAAACSPSSGPAQKTFSAHGDSR